MKWEDTVLDDRQLEIHCGVGINHHIPREKKREAQAEVSFKAGMREVVEWVKGKDHPANISQIHITKQDWQAFLKEKGIEVKSE